VENFILPLAHRREFLIGQYYYKICHAPENHPVVKKFLNPINSFDTVYFRLPRLQPFLLRAESVLVDLNLPMNCYNHGPLIGPVPPWNKHLMDVNLDLIFSITKLTPLVLQKDAFLSTLDVRYGSSLCIYTDGSLIAHPNTGTGLNANEVSAAFCIPQLSVNNSYRLPSSCSICSAELYAIFRALQYIQENVHIFAFPSTFVGIVICSDSQSALQIIQSGKIDDCSFMFKI
jgi:hypothetical protein